MRFYGSGIKSNHFAGDDLKTGTSESPVESKD